MQKETPKWGHGLHLRVPQTIPKRKASLSMSKDGPLFTKTFPSLLVLFPCRKSCSILSMGVNGKMWKNNRNKRRALGLDSKSFQIVVDKGNV